MESLTPQHPCSKLTMILLLLLLIASHASAVKVMMASMQEDGAFTTSTYLKHRNGIGPRDLGNFTICARILVFFLRGPSSAFVSYSTLDDPDSLLVYLHFSAMKHQAASPVIHLKACKNKVEGLTCFSQPFKDFRFQKWFHICLLNKVSGQVQASRGNASQSSLQLFVNGLLLEMEPAKPETSSHLTLNTGGSFIVGQEQDVMGGLLDADQAFSGRISQVEMWSRVLEAEEVSSLAVCSKETVQLGAKVVSWTAFNDDWEVRGAVRVQEVDLEVLCAPTPKFHNKIIMPFKTSFLNTLQTCQQIQGRMPTIANVSKLATNETHWENFRVFEGVVDGNLTVAQAGSVLDRCSIRKNGTQSLGVNFWLGHLTVNGDWVRVYGDNGSIYLPDLRNTEVHTKCSFIYGEELKPERCTNDMACGVCDLGPLTKYLKLKGVCWDDLWTSNYYDLDYYTYGVMNNRPYFRGVVNSHIFYNETSQVWVLQSLRDPSKRLETLNKMHESLPLGTNSWLVVTDEGVCKMRIGQVLNLTLTTCFPNKFTCDDGQCTDLSNRCNTEINCPDKSDEYTCDYLRFGPDYVKELIPRESSSKPVLIYMNVSVLAFPYIDTVNLKFTADFYLNLRWYDSRIDFHDLNIVYSLNSLDSEDKNSIWTPHLGFTNALGPFQTLVDELTRGVLVREDNPLPEDVTQSVEAMLFSGKTNSILLTREYYQDYACEFDLRFYPFDTQVCKMIFEVQGKTEHYEKLMIDGKGVEFRGGRTLVEYEIQAEKLQIDSVNETSVASVMFVFRRRMEFHVTNTFLQTFILVGIGFMSLYFDVDNFTDRIMVTLTTMLVVATVTTNIQSTLPKTSYYKLIDWWLLFILNIMVFAMVWHTYVGYLVSKTREGGGDSPATITPPAKLRPRSRAASRFTRTKVVDLADSRMSINLADLKPVGGHFFVAEPIMVAPPADYTPPPDAAGGGHWEAKCGQQDLSYPKRMNSIGKIIYVLLVLGFNLVFWILAITEYSRPASEYI